MRMFEMEGVKLRFQEEALHSIAKRAIQRKTGARGLRSILEGILLETMFELPTLSGVQEVVITAMWSMARRVRFTPTRTRPKRARSSAS